MDMSSLDFDCPECFELGPPPPDAILNIPPPPLPAFLQLAAPNNQSVPACSPLCEWSSGGQGVVEFVELPKQVFGSSVLDDTWLLVLISCSIGVLLLGSLLALLLLKCREDRANKAAPLHKIVESSSKRCEAVLYPSIQHQEHHEQNGTIMNGSPRLGRDRAVLWATLTPRGTRTSLQHSYMTQQFHHPSLEDHLYYPDPIPTPPHPDPDLYMRSISHHSLRPRVSSPTRIEHPNLPPLNLPPSRTSTLRRPIAPAPHLHPHYLHGDYNHNPLLYEQIN